MLQIRTQLCAHQPLFMPLFFLECKVYDFLNNALPIIVLFESKMLYDTLRIALNYRVEDNIHAHDERYT